MAQIKVDLKRCKSCGICIAFCPKNVYAVNKEGGPVIAQPELCSKCNLCVMRCPDFALELEV
ncbi:2-oxoglutarate-acceptor oxidoreductase subunit OorD [Pelotomaculum schinkii]|uniref:2-oxoglutarate-acceptor oxidoreductase subunit OorD n=1 Tax=Pelotomaculum schinkii TaxID=78350 RepID=A0A4Y7R742_9FIRM|nr:4Fe-4S binding protein [Pelotomaculum schinkii]TEB04461.1 2-oxoglutarate-acceptor oxidoreductase subunit OorD [Pelotomaculum schinkii]